MPIKTNQERWCAELENKPGFNICTDRIYVWCNLPMKFWILCLFISLLCLQGHAQHTYCNPVDIDYRYCISRHNFGVMDTTQSYREGADPTVLVFKKEYYLFVSKSGGYWHSKDLLHWDFITAPNIPWEEYAPTVVEINGKVYYLAAGQNLFVTADPKSGKWEFIRKYHFKNFTDPCLFLDDDKRLYLYYGSSDYLPLYGVELASGNNFEPIGGEKPVVGLNLDRLGWENTFGERIFTNFKAWLEGAWMNKVNGKYYFQYASPLQGADYCDAVYEGYNPMGPFTLSKSNPFAFKPAGFTVGAGHGCTFEDRYGNYWHVGTVGINVKHLFERRINLIPAVFDKDGVLFSTARFGDYPYKIPDKKVKNIESLFTGWMLISYKKPVEASSSLSEYKVEYSVDENIRTFWSASSGNGGEWLMVDLLKPMEVNAIQINFADDRVKILGRPNTGSYQYIVEYSTDKKIWKKLIDNSANTNDYPHDYFELNRKVNARYFRITNLHVPDGNFAVSGFRIFGKGNGKLPATVQNVKVERNKNDKRFAKISWDAVPNAMGYNVKFGTSQDKLYLNYQLYDKNEIELHCLDRDMEYYFEVEAFNENGVAKCSEVK